MINYKKLTEFITENNEQIMHITTQQNEGYLDQQALCILFELMDNDLCVGFNNQEIYDLYMHVTRHKTDYEEALLSGDICNVCDVMEGK